MAMLAAGKLDRRIIIEAPTAGRGQQGGTARTWSRFAEVSAELVQTTGREFLAAQRDVSERRAVFRIRWRSDITAAMRVVYQGVTREIHDVRELGRKEGIELHTSTGATG